MSKRENIEQSSLLSLFKNLGQTDKIFSIELCPNRHLDIEALNKLSPAFCSVIWQNEPDTVLQEISELPSITLTKQLISNGYQVVFHLAGRYLSKVQAKNILDELQKLNVRNILALKGERTPKLEDKSDFPHASDFIEFIKSNYNDYFCIGVAAYIDAHPDSIRKEDEFKYLKMKVDLGADFIITQMIFDLESFLEFSTKCKKFDINILVLPGIYIIDSYEDLMKMTKFCRVKIPHNVIKSLHNNKDNPEDVHRFGIHHCSGLIRKIFDQTNLCINCVHFFSLNNVKLVQEVCKALNLYD
ncbi:hypothetical protein ILUMI_23477 [Ignelater luminosus]|uniref:Methylenetetrahydrofolate reductase (NAD(P)H) n=1 Tax=Ignelater luminosus TaxID=2038154 RepID=A0A8K0CCE3_IGNLU|nr:hypothetical protein ILUMI_23477 [Ignelater luminosus]